MNNNKAILPLLLIVLMGDCCGLGGDNNDCGCDNTLALCLCILCLCNPCCNDRDRDDNI